MGSIMHFIVITVPLYIKKNCDIVVTDEKLNYPRQQAGVVQPEPGKPVNSDMFYL